MDIDEPHAYALSAWHRFDAEVTDELLRAVAGAFALVACADGELAQAEVDRFVDTVISSNKLPRVDPKRLEAIFRDLCQAIFTDADDGRGRALEAVAKVRGDEARAKLVVHAGQVALVADAKLNEAEENALAELCTTLGLDPKAF